MKNTFLFLSVLNFALACGGGGADAAPTAPTPTAPAAQVVTTVNVTLATSSLEAGTTTTATATVLDQNNVAIDGKTVSWASDNVAVATVNSAGVVTGVGAGAAHITGSLEGKQGQATSTVTSWVYDGIVFTNGDYPGSPGGFADVSAFRTTDGRYRMLIGGSPAGAVVISAISADGVKYTLEPGVRFSSPIHVDGLTGGTNHRPTVFRLDDGRLRVFESVIGGQLTPGFYSLTSSDDGLTWTEDSGTRLTRAATELQSQLTGAIVKMKSGGWRFYFSDNPPTVTLPSGFGQLGDPQIKSAFSSDLVNWTMDPGVRIGIGAALSGTGQSPAAVANADGSITIVYFRNKPGVTMQSTSVDGLNFTSETATGFGLPPNDRLLSTPGIDPFMFTLPNGDVRLYFNYGNGTTGTVFTAHHPAFSAPK